MRPCPPDNQALPLGCYLDLPDSGGATVLGPGTELPEVRDLPAVAFAPHPGQLLLYERG